MFHDALPTSPELRTAPVRSTGIRAIYGPGFTLHVAAYPGPDATAQRLRALREGLDLGHIEAAGLLGARPSWLMGIESGRDVFVDPEAALATIEDAWRLGRGARHA